MGKRLMALMMGVCAVLVAAPVGSQESGKILRVGSTALHFPSDFDPLSSYSWGMWALHTNLLTRTLVTYDRSSQESVLMADLATAVPQPTDGGLTYTFTLKAGARFGPPLNRAITSHDVAYAFAWMSCWDCSSAYPFYFTDLIKGMKKRTQRPDPEGISGIETPDDTTIVFHLRRPAGDFLHRLALPATAPIPEEVVGCRSKRDSYGRFVVSSGPYMIEGADEQPFIDCDSMQAFSGYDPHNYLNLVRNPSYDPTTDSPQARANLIDRFEFISFDNLEEAYAALEEGRLDTVLEPPSDSIERAWETDIERSAQLLVTPGRAIRYLSMNMTLPPFNDVHVRKALNLALNRRGMLRARGGPTEGVLATSVLAPAISGEDGYDPYPTMDGRGDIDQAREEMSLSRYDDDGDGLCDRRVCRNVRLLNRRDGSYPAMEPFVVDALESLGIEVEVSHRGYPRVYLDLQDVRNDFHLSMFPGWLADYPDPEALIGWVMHSDSIDCYGNLNYSMIGATSETKKRCRAPGRFANVPGIDIEIDTCRQVFGQEERTNCWDDLNHVIMEEVVPWVPLYWDNSVQIIGDRVTRYRFDPGHNGMALSQFDVTDG